MLQTTGGAGGIILPLSYMNREQSFTRTPLPPNTPPQSLKVYSESAPWSRQGFPFSINLVSWYQYYISHYLSVLLTSDKPSGQLTKASWDHTGYFFPTIQDIQFYECLQVRVLAESYKLHFLFAGNKFRTGFCCFTGITDFYCLKIEMCQQWSGAHLTSTC